MMRQHLVGKLLKCYHQHQAGQIRLLTRSAVLGIQQTRPSQAQWQPELVVFDKYGTLVNIHSVWTPWVEALCHRLKAATGLSLEEKVFRTLDICLHTKRVRSGVVADGTTIQIKQALVKVLHRSGLSMIQAMQAVEECWGARALSDPEEFQQLQKIQQLFKKLKLSGSKIAVSSSDEKRTTLDVLKESDLLQFIDHVHCGGDTFPPTKYESVKGICSVVGADPQKTVVIGDTYGDLRCGREADVALNIGVLSGIGTRLDLSGVADYVADDVYEAVNILQGLEEPEVEQLLGKRQESTDEQHPSLVIFDKDGTLVCFHSMWTPWAYNFINSLEEATGLRLASKVLPELGFCDVTKKWGPAVFTEGTTLPSKDAVADILVTKGMERSEAQKIINSVWIHANHGAENKELHPFDDPASIFKTLKSLGIKVAVCTSDCRKGTEQFLAMLNADPYIDMMMCGDDPDSVPKPAAQNALKICKELGVDPARTVMVGDSATDMKFGKAAKLGSTVAVLTGVGDVAHLAPQADHVVPSISHVLDVVMPTQIKKLAMAFYEAETSKNLQNK